MNARALRCLYSASPAERMDRIQSGLQRATQQLLQLDLGTSGSADRVEQLAGLIHATEREVRSLLTYDNAGGRNA